MEASSASTVSVMEPEVMTGEIVSGEMEESNVEIKVKMDWTAEESSIVDEIKRSIDERIRAEYAQAFAIENKLLSKVRTLVGYGPDAHWSMMADGSYVESWERLTMSDIEQFIQAASAEAFFAGQRVIDDYAEAVFAKFSYDDAYDHEYSSILNGTVNDKTAKAKRKTMDDRWRALYKSLYYKKAKEVVDRLDAHVRRVEKIYAERQKEAERAFRASRPTMQ